MADTALANAHTMELLVNLNRAAFGGCVQITKDYATGKWRATMPLYYVMVDGFGDSRCEAINSLHVEYTTFIGGLRRDRLPTYPDCSGTLGIIY